MNDKPKRQQPGEAGSAPEGNNRTEQTDEIPERMKDADRIANTLQAGIDAIHLIQRGEDVNLGVAVTVFHIYRVTELVTQRMVDRDQPPPMGTPAPVPGVANAEELFRNADIEQKPLNAIALYYVRRLTERMMLTEELLDALPPTEGRAN